MEELLHAKSVGFFVGHRRYGSDPNDSTLLAGKDYDGGQLTWNMFQQ